MSDHDHECWKHDGVRAVPGSLIRARQTPGTNWHAVINFAHVGTEKLWARTVTIHARVKPAPTIAAHTTV